MEILENVLFVLCAILLTAVVIAAFVSSIYGRDLLIFDSYKSSAPKQYRNLKWTCRVNCPMVALMCFVCIVATPLIAAAPTGAIWIAVGSLLGSAMFLWFSVRWFIWSLRE